MKSFPGELVSLAQRIASDRTDAQRLRAAANVVKEYFGDQPVTASRLSELAEEALKDAGEES